MALIVVLISLIAGAIFGGVGVALADVVKWGILPADRSPNQRALVATALLLLAGLYFHYLKGKLRSTAGGLQVLTGAATGWYTAHVGTAAAPTLPLLAISYIGAALLIAQGVKDIMDAIKGRDDLFAAIMVDSYGGDLNTRAIPPSTIS